MKFNFFINSLKNIILNPDKLWDLKASETEGKNPVKNSLFFPLIIIVSVASAAGSMIFTHTELSPLYSIFTGIKSFVILYSTIYATSFIFKEITYPLDLGRDFSISFQIIVYSITPFLLCEILSSIFESLLFVDILGLYGLYVFWTGIEKLLSPPQYKKMPMLIATTVSLGSVYLVINVILTMVTDRIYFALFS